MDLIYHKNLRMLKGSFKGISETPMLATLIASGATSNTINILDVGIGSGEQMYRIADILEKQGIEAKITGVDVFIPEFNQTTGHTIKFIREDFTTLKLPVQYEVVNSTQSLYYFNNLEETLRKMLSLTLPQGQLTVTVWTKRCLLYQLYENFFHVPETEIITDQAVLNTLGKMVDSKCIQVNYFEGEIDLDAVLADETTLRAFLHILSRRGHITECDSQTLQQAQAYISELGTIGYRRNAIISVYK